MGRGSPLAIEDGNFNIDGLKEEQLRTLVEVINRFWAYNERRPGYAIIGFYISFKLMSL